MPRERLPKQAAALAKANGKRPVGRRPRTRDESIALKMESLGISPSKMVKVMEERKVWRLNLELLPPQTSRKSGNEER